MEKSNDKDSGPDRQNAELRTLDDVATKASRSRSRKQENPQRKKVEMQATRRNQKKVAKKNPQKKRSGEKNRKVDKVVNVSETEVTNAALQGTTKLKEQKLYKLVKDKSEGVNFEKVMNNFEKKLTFIQDIETLRLVWFLVYLICKEKKERSLIEQASSSK